VNRREVLFAMLLCFLPSCNAFAQAVGQLFLDKDVYMAGEPIYLHFDLTNAGPTPLQFAFGNSYSSCGGYQVDVSNEPSRENSTCALGGVVSCLIGGITLKPGEVHHDKLLLNYDHDLSKPGAVEIHASRFLNYAPASSPLADFVNPKTAMQFKAEGRFRIRLEESRPENLSVIFQSYLDDLNSKDEQTQQDAARVIGSLAHPFLEDAIIAMASSRYTRSFALIGLRRLNTARSRQVLADIVQGTEGYSYEKGQAIKHLSEMEDKKYFPLLLSEAKNQQPNQSRDYILAAARLGGEDAMPYVNSLLASPDAFLRGNGLMALPETGSRRAVPLMIDLLRDSNVNIGRLASIGLVHMTHRNPLQPGKWYSDTPSTEYPIWLHWWSVEGARAPIYGPKQCGRIDPF
jgi:hypothetical protein